MPSANAQSMPLNFPDPWASWRAVWRLLHRLATRGLRRVPDLPADLRGDVGLAEDLPTDRTEAFFASKQSSEGRDLPL